MTCARSWMARSQQRAATCTVASLPVGIRRLYTPAATAGKHLRKHTIPQCTTFISPKNPEHSPAQPGGASRSLCAVSPRMGPHPGQGRPSSVVPAQVPVQKPHPAGQCHLCPCWKVEQDLHMCHRMKVSKADNGITCNQMDVSKAGESHAWSTHTCNQSSPTHLPPGLPWPSRPTQCHPPPSHRT